jgi:2-methylisocitrate lyase-like PEP mutase family enzyme
VSRAPVGDGAHAGSRREVLREALGDGRLLVAPGVYDGLSARVAQDVGFGAVYVSGGSVARSAGVPDIGLMTMSEVLERVRQVVDAVRCPVIADADTGYGGSLNVARTVRELERLGVAALHLEDQAPPKRCGHYGGKVLVAPSTMAVRIHAALDARTDPGLVIIARTDARGGEGLAAAIDRGRRYAEAGADMLFVEALQSEAEIEAVARAVSAPLVITMAEGGRTPLMPATRLQELGYALLLVPSDLQRAAIFAMQGAARTLLREGSTAGFADRMVSVAERDRSVGLDDWIALENRYAALEREPGRFVPRS